MKAMMLSPRTEWARIAGESTPVSQIYTRFVVPLACLGAVMALVHVSIVGTSEPSVGTLRAPMWSGLIAAAVAFVCGLLGICLVSAIIEVLAPSFGAVRERRSCVALATYSSTPVWIATVFVPLPTVWPILQLLAVSYHTYLLYLGLRVLLHAPRDRVLGYASTIILCTILLEIVFTLATVALGGATHMNPYRAFG